MALYVREREVVAQNEKNTHNCKTVRRSLAVVSIRLTRQHSHYVKVFTLDKRITQMYFLLFNSTRFLSVHEEYRATDTIRTDVLRG